MENNGRNLQEDITINKFDLPAECEKHPQVYMYWAEEHAYAMQVRDRVKDQLDLIAADIDSRIRTDPESFGIAKITEAAVAGAVKKTQEYGDAVEKLHEANLVVNRMAAAKSAMDHRRKALENLTQLAINEFYNSNTAPADSRVSASKKTQTEFAKTRRKVL